MKIYLASDHAGYELKEKVKAFLSESYSEYTIEDAGAHDYDEGDSYTDYVHLAGDALSDDVAGEIASRAIVFGGSGEGEAMVMNRKSGVRCTTYYGYNLELVRLGREHNDANAISFGARFVEEEECFRAIEMFLSTDFEGGRHTDRVKNIDNR